MTWSELADAIAKMTPAERENEVKFVEPYDKDKAGFSLELVKAEENIYVGEGTGEDLFVPEGEYMFR